jgi:hypothetical protein
MRRWLAILNPTDVKRSPAAIFDLRPFEIANLACPQPMPEGDQNQRGVPVAIAGVRYSRVRRSLFGGRVGTDRKSLLGSITLKCAVIGVSPLYSISLTDKCAFSGQIKSFIWCGRMTQSV